MQLLLLRQNLAVKFINSINLAGNDSREYSESIRIWVVLCECVASQCELLRMLGNAGECDQMVNTDE